MSQIDELTSIFHEWAKIFMHQSARDMKKFMEETGLSFSHINVLMKLYHRGKSGISAIGEDLSITNAAASQTVDRLVQMGLVQRNEDPIDRRAKRLDLTKAGREFVEKSVMMRGRWFVDLAKELNQGQLELVTQALKVLVEAARKLNERSN